MTRKKIIVFALLAVIISGISYYRYSSYNQNEQKQLEKAARRLHKSVPTVFYDSDYSKLSPDQDGNLINELHNETIHLDLKLYSEKYRQQVAADAAEIAIAEKMQTVDQIIASSHETKTYYYYQHKNKKARAKLIKKHEPTLEIKAINKSTPKLQKIFDKNINALRKLGLHYFCDTSENAMKKIRFEQETMRLTNEYLASLFSDSKMKNPKTDLTSSQIRMARLMVENMENRTYAKKLMKKIVLLEENSN